MTSINIKITFKCFICMCISNFSIVFINLLEKKYEIKIQIN